MRIWLALLLLAACVPTYSYEQRSDASLPEAAAVQQPEAGCACAPAELCVGSRCVDVATALDGLRVEIACNTTDKICFVTPGRRASQATARGEDGGEYTVWLRFRGVVEQATYDGGSADANLAEGGIGAERLLVGGQPINSQGENEFVLTIDSPPQTYHLNAGRTEVDYVGHIDYSVAVTLRAGARVVLAADPTDTAQYANQGIDGGAVVVPGVAPAPSAFNGQFVQVNVVSVSGK